MKLSNKNISSIRCPSKTSNRMGHVAFKRQDNDMWATSDVKHIKYDIGCHSLIYMYMDM